MSAGRGRLNLSVGYDEPMKLVTFQFGHLLDMPGLRPDFAPSPFLVTEMYRSGTVVAKQKTRMVADSVSPNFGQTLSFNLSTYDADVRFVISAYDNAKPSEAVGRMSIESATAARGLSGWYWLLSPEEGTTAWRAAPAPGEGASNLIVSGRVGPNSVINGVYKLLSGQLSTGKVCYQCPESQLYLYSHPNRGAWLIGTSLGDLSAPAYVASSASEPHLITGVWNIATYGKFHEDPKVKVKLGEQNIKRHAVQAADNPVLKRAHTAFQANVALPIASNLGVAPHEMDRRTAALLQLIVAEREYNQQLKFMLEAFSWDKMLQKHWSEAEHACIFRNVDTLYANSGYFLDALLQQQLKPTPSVGPLLEQMANKFLDLFGEYIESKSLAECTLQNTLSRTGSLDQLLKDRASNTGRPLADYLQVPVVQAAHYPVLFKVIADATALETSDAAACRSAAEKVRWLPRELEQREQKGRTSLQLLKSIVIPKSKQFNDTELIQNGRKVIDTIEVEHVASSTINSSGGSLRNLFKKGITGSLRARFSRNSKSHSVFNLKLVLCSDTLILVKADTNELLEPPTPLTEMHHLEGKDSVHIGLITRGTHHMLNMKQASDALAWREKIERACEEISVSASSPVRRRKPSEDLGSLWLRNPNAHVNSLEPVNGVAAAADALVKSSSTLALAKSVVTVPSNSEQASAPHKKAQPASMNFASSPQPPPIEIPPEQFGPVRAFLDAARSHARLSGTNVGEFGEQDLLNLAQYFDQPDHLSDHIAAVDRSMHTVCSHMAAISREAALEASSLETQRVQLENQLQNVHARLAALQERSAGGQLLSLSSTAMSTWQAYCVAERRRQEEAEAEYRRQEEAELRRQEEAEASRRRQEEAEASRRRQEEAEVSRRQKEEEAEAQSRLNEERQRHEAAAAAAAKVAEEEERRKLEAQSSSAAALRQQQQQAETERPRTLSVLDRRKQLEQLSQNKLNSAASSPETKPLSSSRLVSVPQDRRRSFQAASLADTSLGDLLRVVYPYSDVNGDFSVEAEDTVTLVEKTDVNWWKVSCTFGKHQQGLIPVSYVSPVQAEASSLTVKSPHNTHLNQPVREHEHVRALYAYDDNATLAFLPGDNMEVIAKVDTNWWRVRKVEGGPKSDGLAPVNYIQVLAAKEDAHRVGRVNELQNGGDSKQTGQNQLAKTAREGLALSHPKTDLEEALAEAEDEANVKIYVRALYKYDGADLCFEPGDELAVVEEVDDNWWRVRQHGVSVHTPRSEGLAPRNYVQVMPASELKHMVIQKRWRLAASAVHKDLETWDSMENIDQTADSSNALKRGSDSDGVVREHKQEDTSKVTAAYPYSAQDDAFSFQPGTSLKVLKKIDENWLQVQKEDGSQGLAPRTYLNFYV